MGTTVGIEKILMWRVQRICPVSCVARRLERKEK